MAPGDLRAALREASHNQVVISTPPAVLVIAETTGSSTPAWPEPIRASEGASFPGGNFRGTTGKEGNWEGANLTFADFSWSDLPGSTFEKATLVRANFEGAELSHSKFRRADLTEARLVTMNLFRGSLEKAEGLLERVHVELPVVEAEGHEVVAEASDGVEAIDMFRTHHPELVTMDIVMPRRSGIDAVKGILAKHPDAKIVMCSALGQETQHHASKARLGARALDSEGVLEPAFTGKKGKGRLGAHSEGSTGGGVHEYLLFLG